MNESSTPNVFWIHPQFMDYRMPLFSRMAKAYNIQWHLGFASEYDKDYNVSVARSRFLRMPSLKDIAAIWRGVRDNDVVVSSFVWNGTTVTALLAAKFYGKPSVVWEEKSFHFPGFKEAIKVFFIKRFLKLATSFYVMGSVQQKLLEKFGANPQDIHVANEYPGVVYKTIAPSDDVFPAHKPCVLFLGRLIPVKGVEYLIDAMKCVIEKVPDASLMIVGDGPLRQSLENRAGALLNDRIHFLGRVDGWDRKAALFQQVDLLAVPSVATYQGQAEGGPLVVLEALSAGVPVVSSNQIGSSTQHVKDGINGYVAPERDAEALADKIVATLSDAQRLGKGAACYFEQLKGHDHQAKILQEALKASLQGVRDTRLSQA